MNPTAFDPHTGSPKRTRRDFLTHYGGGLGGIALAHLLAEDKLLQAAAGKPKSANHIPRAQRSFDLAPKEPHFAPQAKAVISLFQHGGPSHMDLFDPKPELTRLDGKTFEGDIQYSFINRASKRLMRSPFSFRAQGQCGTQLSELLPETAKVIDDLCVVRSCYTGINGHEPSIWSMNTGEPRPGRPALGSWIAYALGNETRDLPAYLVLTDPGGLPVDGVRNWSQGWLPTVYQGTPLRAKEPRILNLEAPPATRGRLQQEQREYIAELSRAHLERVGGDPILEARIQSYELAARMQGAAQEALNLRSEPDSVRKLYGLDNPVTRNYGERCLLARRLVERGVRFVHILINGQIWDNHSNIQGNLAKCCARTDQPSAALVQDLKERGLLDSTLVLWGGEIGRLPVVENHGSGKKAGRDHNGQGFSMWLAGGGVRGGMTYGETDEVGHRAVENRVGAADLHATLLYLLGIDHQRLSYHHNGRPQRLTRGEGRIIQEILQRPPV